MRRSLLPRRHGIAERSGGATALRCSSDSLEAELEVVAANCRGMAEEHHERLKGIAERVSGVRVKMERIVFPILGPLAADAPRDPLRKGD